ncbi:MAG: hypothetical protein EOM12_17870 [Verrucomicrobiae bacterium]|nr:hypothetical protein [Verrucomicrobiae bacterium]
MRRHHFDSQRIQRAMKKAGKDIRTMQQLLGHSDVKTTEIYKHVLNRGPLGVISPLDTL